MARKDEGSWWERVALSVLLLAGMCAGCAWNRSELIPIVGRPDTRLVSNWTITEGAVTQAYQLVAAAYPNEVGFCLLGTVQSSREEVGRVDVVADSVVAEASDSADPTHVWFPRVDDCAMPGVVGIGHDHPLSFDRPCEHSDQDALRLVAARALFSFVMCMDGTSEVLWQDGRRAGRRWMKPSEEGGGS